MATVIDHPDLDLSAPAFAQITRRLYQISGISLQQGKEGLVKARLARRMRELGLTRFDEYVALVERQPAGEEAASMVDVLTTNKTSFFRDAPHFTLLREHVLRQLKQTDRPLQLWSAGCSTGEEPYTIAITLRQALAGAERRQVRVLATDISRPVLAAAAQAAYGEDVVQDLAPNVLRESFDLTQPRPPRTYRVKAELRSMVSFGYLNLMQPWPMRGPFDAIFCRNVMIYFDRPTRERLVRRFYEMTRPGGYFFVGLSESLSPIKHDFEYVQPGAYLRPA